jgi:hypothetical protein
VRFGVLQHALRNAVAAIASIEVHAAKLRAVLAASLDTEHADDLPIGYDHPEGVALGSRKDALQLSQLSADCRRNVLLEQFAHIGRGQLAVDAGEECHNLLVVRILICADREGSLGLSHLISVPLFASEGINTVSSRHRLAEGKAAGALMGRIAPRPEARPVLEVSWELSREE